VKKETLLETDARHDIVIERRELDYRHIFDLVITESCRESGCRLKYEFSLFLFFFNVFPVDLVLQAQECQISGKKCKLKSCCSYPNRPQSINP
jgi:hypothetical protein